MAPGVAMSFRGTTTRAAIATWCSRSGATAKHASILPFNVYCRDCPDGCSLLIKELAKNKKLTKEEIVAVFDEHWLLMLLLLRRRSVP